MATMGSGDDNEWQKLSPDQKVQHKAWQARIIGYEECIKLFHSQNSDQSPEFNKYVGLVKKFVIDPNKYAREKALDAVFAFVEEANIAGTTVNEVASGLITKCLNGRLQTKERAFDILLMYIEIEKQVEIEEELVKGLENKQPKIIQACLELFRKGLSEFGSNVLPIEPFLKQVIPLLNDPDKTIRDESKLLIVEIYKWIEKQTLMSIIQNVKPIQMEELQIEFEKLDLNGIDKPRQTRFLRSQQDLKQKMEDTVVISSVVIEDPNIEIQEDIDPFEMLEPVDILERLSKDFFEKIESKQWKDRKEVLDDLLTLLTQNSKLTSHNDYSELVKILKKIIAKDINVPVVLIAAKCLTALAKGLRKAFQNYALGVIEVCLDRCREKKTNVIEILRETCEATYSGINLEQFSKIAVTLLTHKIPVVQQCTQQFLTKCFSMATQTTLPTKTLKIYLLALIKNTTKADLSVRDSAFESLGMLWKCLGEKHILSNLTDLDELKLNKIKEYAEKSDLLNLRGEPRSRSRNHQDEADQTQQINDAIIALGIDPSFLDPKRKKKNAKKRKNKKNFGEEKDWSLSEDKDDIPVNSTPTHLPSTLSFTSDQVDLSMDSPVWLNEQFVADYRLDDEVFENDVNVVIDQNKDLSEELEKKPMIDEMQTNNIVLETMINLFHQFEQRTQRRMQSLESKFDQLFVQLSQKVDNLYERGSASTIITHFNANHFLEAPLLPTSRVFDSHYSKETKRLFAFFAQEMNKNYAHLWNNVYAKFGISLRPEQIEIDLLGFAYERNNKKKAIFKSPKLQPVQSNSSYSFIDPFKPNVIIIGEVTTAIIDFNYEELINLEKTDMKLNNQNMSTYNLVRKLLQLERLINFVLLYFVGAKIDNLLVALVGRFHHTHSPQQVYKSVFKSHFGNKIPLLYKLFKLEDEHKSKQLYFVS